MFIFSKFSKRLLLIFSSVVGPENNSCSSELIALTAIKGQEGGRKSSDNSSIVELSWILGSHLRLISFF